MKINCIVVDDESLAREGIINYIKQIDFFNLQGDFKNAVQAANFLKSNNTDLIFLDIEMPLLSGLDFLRSTSDPVKVIFTTAYSNYALECYEFDVIDYLVKPISFDRFLKAANKAYSVFDEIKSKGSDQDIFIKTDQKLVRVIINDILFIEAMQNYLIIQTVNEKLITLLPLKGVFNLLPENDFIQTHKSFIVNKNRVEAIVGNELIMLKHRIPISFRLKSSVLDQLTRSKILKK